MKKIWIGLKKRWEIDSDKQAVKIWIVFALTGLSILVVRRSLYWYLGLTFFSPLWIHILLFLFVIWPIFYVLLLLWSSIFGEYKFFIGFIKNIVNKIITKFKNK